MEKVEQAGMTAGIHASSISVVDPARQPVKPVSPDLPVYMAITLFVGMWASLLAALGVETFHRSARGVAVFVFICLVASGVASAQPQAPMPNPSGLPMGVAHPPANAQTNTTPNPQGAPAIWSVTGKANEAGLPPLAVSLSGLPMPAAIAPGDSLEISEFHTPEFHAQVRVSQTGTVTLPMIDEIAVGGLDERGAARAIERALIAKGMLLHPEVSVLVTGYAGQDVSVLGEVTRPGVYPYTMHHRLLDLLSAASGLSASAGRLVNVYHRSDPKTAVPLVLDPGGTDTSGDHNPELAPGDTVQVSRAGLVYVIGDVVRPGGFAVDPAQGLTVVQALSLAWGPTLNAAAGKVLLIREEKGGRTLTSLNLRRMMHGQDPDQPVHDRDILFVPDSTAKNLMNKTLESTIQSAIGLTIYAGLVYSQRF
jgi:polysaccharide export outer membrane protein